jgi:hypothetical protein
MRVIKTALSLLYVTARAVVVDSFDPSVLKALPGMGGTPPEVGSNVEGGSVFSNYLKMRDNNQFFLIYEGPLHYEKPSTKVVNWRALHWCSNLHFSEIEAAGQPVVGYSANCVGASLDDDSFAEAAAAGGQVTYPNLVPDKFTSTYTFAAVYVPQINAFEGHYHENTDNFNTKFWDDGRSVSSALEWEVHDEGDTHTNAATSSLSVAVKVEWISAEWASRLLGNDVADLTPEIFQEVYKEVWTAHTPHATILEAEKAKSTTKASEGGNSSSGNGRKLFPVIPAVLLALLV